MRVQPLSSAASQLSDTTNIFISSKLARNLNVAVRPACHRCLLRQSAATKLIGPLGAQPALEPAELLAGRQFPSIPPGGRRSFVTDHENRHALSRLYRRAETLSRRLHDRSADQPGRSRSRRRRRQGECRAHRSRCRAHQGAGQGHRRGQEARRPGEVQARRASVRCLSATAAAGARQRAAEPGGQFPLALLRHLLRRADAGLLHVPAAHPERHHEALAAGRPCRSRR